MLTVAPWGFTFSTVRVLAARVERGVGIAEERRVVAALPRLQRDVGEAGVERRAISPRAVVHQVEPGQEAGPRRPAGGALANSGSRTAPRRLISASRLGVRTCGCPSAPMQSARHWSAQMKSTFGRSSVIAGLTSRGIGKRSSARRARPPPQRCRVEPPCTPPSSTRSELKPRRRAPRTSVAEGCRRSSGPPPGAAPPASASASSKIGSNGLPYSVACRQGRRSRRRSSQAQPEAAAGGIDEIGISDEASAPRARRPPPARAARALPRASASVGCGIPAATRSSASSSVTRSFGTSASQATPVPCRMKSTCAPRRVARREVAPGELPRAGDCVVPLPRKADAHHPPLHPVDPLRRVRHDDDPPPRRPGTDQRLGDEGERRAAVVQRAVGVDEQQPVAADHLGEAGDPARRGHEADRAGAARRSAAPLSARTSAWWQAEAWPPPRSASCGSDAAQISVA